METINFFFMFLQLRQFFYQLLGNDVVVSACGLCQVDRRILTSVTTLTQIDIFKYRIKVLIFDSSIVEVSALTSSF
jgi:hypothetical protein